MKNFKQLSEKEMNSVKGGKRTVEWYDVNGDGREDKVITRYNKPLTMYIKHLTVCGLSRISSCIKSSCNLTGKCFEMLNISYTNPMM